MGIRDLFSRKKDTQEIYRDLRQQALHLTREKAGITASDFPDAAWGAIMDWGLQNGTATVVALADGTASIYLSSGGGYIGGQGQEQIASAAKLAVKIAHALQSKMQPASSDLALPNQGGVVLYAQTDSGLLAAPISQAELQSNKHALSPLANAMQNVITQYRHWNEKKAHA